MIEEMDGENRSAKSFLWREMLQCSDSLPIMCVGKRHTKQVGQPPSPFPPPLPPKAQWSWGKGSKHAPKSSLIIIQKWAFKLPH